MPYLTICTGGPQPARRIDLAHFAELFTVPEAPPLRRPRRPRRSASYLVAAPLLLAALAVDLVMIAHPAAPSCAPRSLPASCASATPS